MWRRFQLPMICNAVVVMLAMSTIAPNAAADETSETRATARAFLRELFIEKDINGAYERHAVENFVQHNPEMADGIEGRRAFFAAKAKHSNGNPAHYVDVFNAVLVDKDL